MKKSISIFMLIALVIACKHTILEPGNLNNTGGVTQVLEFLPQQILFAFKQKFYHCTKVIVPVPGVTIVPQEQMVWY